MARGLRSMFLLSTSLVFVASCSDGTRDVPMPETEKLVEVFQSHRKEAEQLVSMIKRSPYVGVHIASETEAEGFWFEGPEVRGQVAESEKVDNAEAWISLFKRLDVHGVNWLEGEYVELPIFADYWGSDFPGSARYEYSENIDSINRACGATRIQNACGECNIGLGDNWWLVLKWVPEQVIDELVELDTRTELSEAEKLRQSDLILFDCYKRGGTKIDPKLRDRSNDAA